jgi:hypothetical protein
MREIWKYTSLCLEVGKGRNRGAYKGAHTTVLGSGKRGEISEHISLGLEIGWKKKRENIWDGSKTGKEYG